MAAAVVVVEQEKWKSGDGGDAVVVKQEDPSLLSSHSYQLCDLSKATYLSVPLIPHLSSGRWDDNCIPE